MICAVTPAFAGGVVPAIAVPGKAAHVEEPIESLQVGARPFSLQLVEVVPARRPVPMAQVFELAFRQLRREAERKGDLRVDVVHDLDLGGLLAEQNLGAAGERLDVDLVCGDKRYELLGQVKLARGRPPDVLLQVDSNVGENSPGLREQAVNFGRHTMDKARHDH